MACGRPLVDSADVSSNDVQAKMNSNDVSYDLLLKCSNFNNVDGNKDLADDLSTIAGLIDEGI